MVKRLSHSLLPENDSFSSRSLWVPPQYRTVYLHLVLMIFETSVLMHFSYACIFFPNIRELLKILAVLPIGNTEAERSFSCLRRLHTLLRSTMSTDRLSDLSVIAMHGNTMVALETDSIC